MNVIDLKLCRDMQIILVALRKRKIHLRLKHLRFSIGNTNTLALNRQKHFFKKGFDKTMSLKQLYATRSSDA